MKNARRPTQSATVKRSLSVAQAFFLEFRCKDTNNNGHKQKKSTPWGDQECSVEKKIYDD